MGTPEFAVVILNKLIANGSTIVSVITAPDKPAGRGQKITESAVKLCALEKGIPVLQPTSLKDEAFQSELKALEADLFVVVAFRMLPESIWSMPPKGTINLHGSLLPKYRGAAPINWAIMNGETKTGVSSFFIEKEIDTGNILLQEEIAIGTNETAGELHDKLAELGASVIVRTVEAIETGRIQSKPQSEFDLSEIPHAPKIFKEDCRIDWDLNARNIHNFIRGLSPYPAAWTYLMKGDKRLICKLFNSEETTIKVTEGVIKESDLGFLFPTSDFYILVKEIQLEGKRRMHYREFSAGNSIEEFSIYA